MVVCRYSVLGVGWPMVQQCTSDNDDFTAASTFVILYNVHNVLFLNRMFTTLHCVLIYLGAFLHMFAICLVFFLICVNIFLHFTVQERILKPA